MKFGALSADLHGLPDAFKFDLGIGLGDFIQSRAVAGLHNHDSEETLLDESFIISLAVSNFQGLSGVVQVIFVVANSPFS